MTLTEHEIFERYAIQRMHCTLNTFLPYLYEFNCTACGDKLQNGKLNKQNFNQKTKRYRSIEILSKNICLCIDECKTFEGNVIEKLTVYSTRIERK